MFTGIISAARPIVSVETLPSGSRLSVERPPGWRDVSSGESISVSGVCLTALPGPDGPLRFDVSPETLRRSTLGSLRTGRCVNLERALAVGDRLGGHVVAGHVDATTPVTRVERTGEFWTFGFRLAPEWARYVVEKGSIALDGISLTVAALRADSLEVAVIPHTYRETTLSDRTPGDLVNVEVDVLGKYVERLLGGHAPDPDVRLRRLLGE